MVDSESTPALRYQESRQVILIGAAANIVLAVVKIFAGVVGRSQSLVADGVHSVSDLLTDALVYFAARHAQEGPDAEHPYGHDRFETAATMGLGVLLIVVAIGIVWDAVARLFHPEQLLRPSILTLFVALFSILANEGLYRYTLRVARNIRSGMLEANAWHHRSDAVSSVVVLVGVGGTLLGLPYLDAIAAVGVGLMIAHIGWRLGWGAMQELVDIGLSEERVKKIRDIILSVGGVRAVHMLRTRKMGGHAVADVHVMVEPWLSVSEGHVVGDAVALKLADEVEELNDVTIHIDPEDDENSAPCRGLPLRSEAVALLAEQWKDIACASQQERVILHYLDGHIDVDVFFPLWCYENPEQAQAMKTALGDGIRTRSEFRTLRVYFG